ncbi:hypothetical protein D1007_54765 [Hordeum vulgare]|nr:hypothetical protein D1007_54765 [Hordeum vulgare]
MVLPLPTFLRRHLSPLPLPLLDNRPYALVIQPQCNFGHFPTSPSSPIKLADCIPANVPLQPKYMATNSDCLLDTARDESVFQLLYSTSMDDPAPIADDHHDDTDRLAITTDLLVDSNISSSHATSTIDTSIVDVAPPPLLGERVGDCTTRDATPQPSRSSTSRSWGRRPVPS